MKASSTNRDLPTAEMLTFLKEDRVKEADVESTIVLSTLTNLSSIRANGK
jgi:hypothetical protein